MKIFWIILGGVALALSPLGAQTPADTVRLNLLMDSIVLNEVVVTERRTPAAAGRWSDMNPVELVTVAGANGDFYKALQTLPGTQLQGETAPNFRARRVACWCAGVAARKHRPT